MRNYCVFTCLIVILTVNTLLAQLPYIQHPAPVGMVTNTARINDLDFDVNNNKWVCFGNYGLGMYDGVNWTIYNTGNSGIPSDSVVCLDFDNAGNSWIGTNDGAVFKSGTNWTVYNTSNSGLPSNSISAILSDGSSTWFGTRNGLVFYDGTNWSLNNTINSGLPNDSITVIKKGNNNDIWVGTRNGAAKFNNGNWTVFTPANSVLSRYITDIEVDNYDRVWISCGVFSALQSASTDGIYFIENGVVKSFQDDLFYHETDIIYPRAVNFSKDGNGKIYFRGNMYLNQGIFIVDGGSFDYFIIPNINFGIQSSGIIFEVDNLNLIWSLTKYRFYMYSFDTTNYTEPLEAVNYNSFRELDVNDVAAGINAGGDMHWDLSNAKYEVPKGSGKNSVFTSALWIGALDQAGQLHLSAQTYRQTGDDFWPGPIDEISVPFDSASTIAFNRVWKIDKWKIEEFKTNFLQGNVTNGTYMVPEEMASWPAKGSGIVTGNLAPFVDFNTDGFYNPIDGDYPEIKGDQMIYCIFNDSLANHTSSGGQKMGIEVHATAYSFYCQGTADTNDVINRTTFYNYSIINRSQHDYDSLFLSLWCDMDLGNASDDNVGCDTTLATGFTYNGDNDDEMVYGLNPPIQNLKILKGMLADPGDGIDNDIDGTIDEPGERTTMNHFMYYNNAAGGPTTNPNGAYDYWNYMQSIWLDGQHVTYGGDGRDTANSWTNFMFSGTPYSGSGWTQLNIAIPSDRRFLLSSGPASIASGDTVTIDFAYVFTWDSLNANGLTTSIAKNIQGLQLVQDWFDNNSFPSCINYSVGVEETNSNQNQFSIFPNPASNRLFVNRNTDNQSALDFVIYDLLGAEVKSGKLFSDEINIEELSVQIYILKIGNENSYEYLRFVKM